MPMIPTLLPSRFGDPAVKRLLSLGLMVFPVAGLLAADPVSVYPTVSGGSLSQSLPSVVSGGVSATPAPPVMVSQPTWGGTACPPACPPQTPLRLVPRPHLAPRIPHFQTPCATGSAPRGNLLERLRAWLCGGPGPAANPGLVFAPPVAPLQAWVPNDGHIVGAQGVAGWPSKCDGNRRRLFPMGGGGGLCPTDGCPTTAVGPRPILIPLPTACDNPANCGRTRPGLLRRIMAFFTPEWMCDDGYAPMAQPAYGVPVTGGYPTPTWTGPTSTVQPATPVRSVTQPGLTGAVQPTTVRTGVTGGYHFATTPTVGSPAVYTNPVPTTAPLPTATQPFTQQR
jgi:hypothetical protein